ncbi:amino acid permease-domain-containing protein [Catenaria anguillulae PL171]|uniref:Amino acid permease-domain-containing protein n=1 Tax=Catenaria anguillulae PL171 TaxID=765915 RepID=A0A1Y2H8R7_9FUNG|nr:amino acid permease-domain-containing protein [Catenaria anguillulae PL171]
MSSFATGTSASASAHSERQPLLAAPAADSSLAASPPNSSRSRSRAATYGTSASATPSNNASAAGATGVAAPPAPNQLPHKKLDTTAGVFLPVFLSIWGLLFFIRYPFLVGHAGVLGLLAMLAIGYAITTLTALSVSAISTNGRVRAGGPYFMISRCLGPEFGGAIGIVFYIGGVLGNGMSAVGFVEPLLDSFPGILPSSPGYTAMYAASLLAVATLLSFMGSSVFARLNYILFFLLNMSTFSALLSLLFGTHGLKPSWSTFLQNLYPAFQPPAFSAQTLFGILFPACSGILAGASMSGELKDPSRSIPKGTLYGILVTLSLYILSLLVMACTIPRDLLVTDLGILHTLSAVPSLYITGLFAASFYGVFGGILGTSQLLRAILHDQLFPFLPRRISMPLAIGITWTLTQLAMLVASDINTIAPFYSQTNLMCYAILNLACLLLRLAGAPNFRPRFRYFGRVTASLGMAFALAAMFIVDVTYAAACILVSASLFASVHYFGEPKAWGDVGQALMYHQVRRLLLKLDRQPAGPRLTSSASRSSQLASLKLWRPQILLVPPPTTTDPLMFKNTILFANDMKKGSLFMLGKLIAAPSLRAAGPDNVKHVYRDWCTKIVDQLSVKAFVHVAVDSDARRGVVSMVMGAGIGAMKPNIVMVPYPSEQAVGGGWEPVTFLGIVEDTLALDKAVAVTRNFARAEGGAGAGFARIDVWPLCLSLAVRAGRGADQGQGGKKKRGKLLRRRASAVFGFPSSTTPSSSSAASSSATDAPTSYVDDVATFTLLLQLSFILSRTDRWRHARIRLFLVVESRAHRSAERRNVLKVLTDLRMADVIEVVVVCLEDERAAGVMPAAAAGAPETALSPIPASDDLEPVVEDAAGEDGADLDEVAAANLERARFKAPRRLFSPTADTPTNGSPAPAAAASAGDGDDSVLAQVAAIHRVVCKYSGSGLAGDQRGADVVLTTLPVSPTGEHEPDAVVAGEYLGVLDKLTSEWPPTVMVAASRGQFSVTTELQIVYCVELIHRVST